MKLTKAKVRNFRRLENVSVDFEEDETVFVGPNNSGKTSATDVFRLFLKSPDEFSIHDFSVSQIEKFNEYGTSIVARAEAARAEANNDGHIRYAVTITQTAEGQAASELAIGERTSSAHLSNGGSNGDGSNGDATRDNAVQLSELPCIELDLWFSVDPDTEFGRVSSLLPDYERIYEEVGIRLRYVATDARKMEDDYLARCLRQKPNEQPRKSLSEYLASPAILHQYFAIHYYALEQSGDGYNERPLAPEEGSNVIKSIVRVEFVDAQRKIDDHGRSGSTILSKVFDRYYSRNLTQAEAKEEAHDIIDSHNDSMDKHYAKVFAELLDVIQLLGIPAARDRSLQLVSSLVPESVLKGSAVLTYYDAWRKHKLPERYNGLGIKNLIYLAIQICECHLNWMRTKVNRPLGLLLFIEEPEVHLHAQAQQTFIGNAWKIIRNASEQCNEKDKTPQLVVTTHSSHILDAVDFEQVRYFRRVHCSDTKPIGDAPLHASQIVSLREFKPTPKKDDDGEVEVSSEEALEFLKRYLKLVHCDLFFADAAVLVEGPVEKLLLPLMIAKEAPYLQQRFVTVLEIGGAYSHVFADLLHHISIPYLVITDIDSVNEDGKACRADTVNAVTSNGSIKYFLNVSSVSELAELEAGRQEIASRNCYVAYQRPLEVAYEGSIVRLHGRTFEEAFVYHNLELFREGGISLGKRWPAGRDVNIEYGFVYEAIRTSTFKKVPFALKLASLGTGWMTPAYISEGLRWLAGRLPLSASLPAASEETAE